MEVKFPQYVDYKYFYRFSLKKIMAFLNSPTETVLIIDLQNTEHVKPSVLCDLLSSFNLIHSYKDANIYLKFGRSRKLSLYLTRTGFFLHSDHWRLFSTDLVSMTTEDSNSSRAQNTDKVGRIDIPKYDPANRRLDISQNKSDEIKFYVTQGLLKLAQKGSMKQYGNGMSLVEQLTAGYVEIIENSYEHSNLRDCVEYCYYTFQNYRDSGFFFANSDLGCGFFRSLMNKMHEMKQKTSPEEVAEFQKKLLFSPDEYAKLQADRVLLNCAAIIESLSFRITKDASLNRGFPYIFSTFVLQHNGIFMVHDENVMLEMDREFVETFFIIANDPEGKPVVTGYKRKELRNVVLNQGVRSSLISKGNLRIFDYTFPGVHMAVEVRGGER